MTTGIVLKVDRIPFEDGLHLIQYLKGNGFAPIDINSQRPAQVRAAIEKAQSGRNKKIPILLDVIDEYQGEEVEILGTLYPVLDVTERDEVKTLSLIQEALGIVATG